MFLSLRELKHSRLRYLLVGAIITMIAWLVFLLSGLANGLASDNAAALLNMKADYLVLQSGTQLLMHRSTLPMTLVDQIKQTPGVKAAAPLGQLTVTTARVSTGEQFDATILAIDSASFLAPKITEGQGLNTAQPEGVVVDEHFARHGLKIGDQLRVTSAGQILTITGFTTGQTYGHLPVIFTGIPLWQSLKFSGPGAKDQASNPVSVIALQTDEATAASLSKTLNGVEIAPRSNVLQNVPGYKEETGTINMIQVFLFLIAAFIIAVFFYVLTLQKTNQFGILKALGASTRFLVKDLIGQVILLTLAGVLVGAVLTYGVAAAIPAAVPFALENTLVLSYGFVLLAVALVGTLLSLRHIAKIDALIAIGKMD